MLKILKPLFHGINGIQIASDSQKKAGLCDKSLTYGEIQPQSFLSILGSVVPKGESCEEMECGVFVDLGCGTGLAVMCVALSAYRFSKCWGIEIVPELAAAARVCAGRLETCLTTCREKEGTGKLEKPQVACGEMQGGAVVSVSTQSGLTTSAAGHHDAEYEGALLSVVLDAIVGDIKSEETAVFDIEVVVAALIKLIGHKEYKKMLKGKYKTFKRFIVSHPERFLLINENTFTVTTRPKSPSSFVDSHTSEDCRLLHQDGDHEEEVNGHEECAADKSSRVEDVSDDLMQHASLSDNINHNDNTVLHVDMACSPTFSPEDEVMRIMQQSAGGRRLLQEGLPALQLDTGDIFELDWWSDAAVVYCASLLFSDHMMVRLGERVAMMRPGASFISLRPLPLQASGGEGSTALATAPKRVVLVSDSFYKMSWHMARVYIYHIRSET